MPTEKELYLASVDKKTRERMEEAGPRIRQVSEQMNPPMPITIIFMIKEMYGLTLPEAMALYQEYVHPEFEFNFIGDKT